MHSVCDHRHDPSPELVIFPDWNSAPSKQQLHPSPQPWEPPCHFLSLWNSDVLVPALSTLPADHILSFLKCFHSHFIVSVWQMGLWDSLRLRDKIRYFTSCRVETKAHDFNNRTTYLPVRSDVILSVDVNHLVPFFLVFGKSWSLVSWVTPVVALYGIFSVSCWPCCRPVLPLLWKPTSW